MIAGKPPESSSLPNLHNCFKETLITAIIMEAEIEIGAFNFVWRGKVQRTWLMFRTSGNPFSMLLKTVGYGNPTGASTSSEHELRGKGQEL
jgi:hypothetical protein